MAGKVVVVTGAGRGQGAAFARRLTADGATVVGLDLSAEPVEQLDGVRYVQLDVTDAGGWAALGADLVQRHGRVDGLVANAGITWRARVPDAAPEDVARVHAVNVLGTLLGIQTVTPLMAGGGSIVVIGSVAGLTGHYPVAYTASKWALRGVAKAASLELGPRNIRVNIVHPGWIETPMSASAAPAFRAGNLAETPLGRLGTVDDITPLITFLLSDDATYISGAEIPVDGGLSAHGGTKSISDAMREPT
ncbi:SDR family oxidoreductase [Modestobacter sp. I12A-02628]|uniref:SDR family oxidoreductase n=1 Tax=Goekera deserti TaxID=2497753 RepID=A0A7K3WFL7_9ACTN|nr:SDR family oxidoreductase [Goekera deserti]NDI46714.1 SDR family oxidoreductase [Goekera deserti]NEL54283.1 SDR family oxidoreductase [Goekera deserti]